MIDIPKLTAADRADVQALYKLQLIAERTEHATRSAAAASLAGGMIAASGRPHSPGEAYEVFRTCYNLLYPERAKLTDEQREKVHS